MRNENKAVLQGIGRVFPKFIFTFILITLTILGSVQNGSIVFADSEQSLNTPEQAQNNENRHNTIINTAYGRVMGFLDQEDTWGWKGIPFAKPPVGDLRWKAPQDPESWNGVRQAVEFSGKCVQYNYDGDVEGDEDCLYLNIWRPQTRETDLPVYFWIHGGGNSTGTASSDFYNGSKIASRGNMVVVTINYRLGPMGWFTHPALWNGDALDDSGNYGTMDMVKALEWVQDNIEAFGGDPNNVTIAGESAGASDVFSLLISPIASGLFHGGIAESGGTSTSSIAEGIAHAEDVIDRLLENDGLAEVPGDDVEGYLMSKTAAEILETYDAGTGGMISSPKIFTDGTVIHADGFYGALDKGEYNQVALILGCNHEEMKLFMASGFSNYPSNLVYQSYAEAANNFWRSGGVDDPATALADIGGQPDVYAYEFLYGAYRYKYTGTYPNIDIIPDPDRYNAWLTDYYGTNFALLFGSSHALDLSFFWGNLYFFGYEDFIFREDNRLGREALTQAMMAYAAQFAHTGHPGDAGGVAWTPWSNVNGESKRILLDADDTETIIEMSTQ